MRACSAPATVVLLLLAIFACIANFKDTLSKNLKLPERGFKTQGRAVAPKRQTASLVSSCAAAPSYTSVWEGLRADDGEGMRAAVYAPGKVDEDEYVISIVHALQLSGYSVTIYTSQEYRWKPRLLEISAALGVYLKSAELDVRVWDANAPSVRIFFAFGYEKIPQVHNLGLQGFFVCRFPSDVDAAITDSNLAALNSFDGIFLDSHFSFKWYNIFITPALQRLYDQALLIPSIEILHPPASMILNDAASARYNIILLDHFLQRRGSKSHIYAIEMFAKLVNGLSYLPINSRLVFLGRLVQGHDAYLRSLRSLVSNLQISERVDFVLSASPEVVAAYLHGALIQWHLTGLEVDMNTDPAGFEHFGASIIKCMSAGCIPIAAHGGPDDIITDGVNGFVVASTEDVLQRTLQIFSAPLDQVLSLRDAAMQKALQFSFPRFQEHLLLFLGRAAKVRPFRHFLSSTLLTARRCATMTVAVSSPMATMIIEGRNHYALEYVITNAMSILHKSRHKWSLHIYHTSFNSALVKNIVSTPGLGNTQLHELSPSILQVKGYNEMMSSGEIWRMLGNAEKVLVLQTDAVIVRPGIEEFLKYDIVQSPSQHTERWMAAEEPVLIGTSNDIFSIRSVPIMKTLSSFLANLTDNSKVDPFYYARNIYKNLSECPRPSAYNFCLEVPNTDMHPVAEIPFAMQAAWLHNSPNLVKQLLYRSFLSTVAPGYQPDRLV